MPAPLQQEQHERHQERDHERPGPHKRNKPFRARGPAARARESRGRRPSVVPASRRMRRGAARMSIPPPASVRRALSAASPSSRARWKSTCSWPRQLHLKHHRPARALDAHLEVVRFVDVAKDEEILGQALRGQGVRLLPPPRDGRLLGHQPASRRPLGEPHVDVEALALSVRAWSEPRAVARRTAERHRTKRGPVVFAGKDALEPGDVAILVLGAIDSRSGCRSGRSAAAGRREDAAEHQGRDRKSPVRVVWFM